MGDFAIPNSFPFSRESHQLQIDFQISHISQGCKKQTVRIGSFIGDSGQTVIPLGQFGIDGYSSLSSLIILEVQETIDRVVANVPLATFVTCAW